MNVPSPPLKRLPIPPTLKKLPIPPTFTQHPNSEPPSFKSIPTPSTLTAHLILQRANEHEQLVKAYDERSDAPAQLEQASEAISGLEKELAALEKRLKALKVKTNAERSDHAALRDSTLRKLAYTMTGRKKAYKKKVSEEESGYIQALQNECDEKAQVEIHRRRLSEACTSRTPLQESYDEFDQARQRLDSFYDSIFTDIRDVFPDEEAAKEQISIALSTVLDLQGRIQSEERVLELVGSAKQKMGLVVDQAGRLTALAVDLLCSGNSTSPERRRAAVDKVRNPAGEVRLLVHQARAIQPLIESMDHEEILLPKGRYWAEIVTDDLSVSFRQKVEKAKDDLTAIQNRVKTLVVSERERMSTLKGSLKQAEKELERARTELRDVRRKIFERTIAEEGDWDAPPKYQPP